MIWAELKENADPPNCGTCVANDMIKELEAQYADILKRNFKLARISMDLLEELHREPTVEEEIIFEET